MTGFADHKSAPTAARRVGRKVPRDAVVGDPKGIGEGVWKLMLDDDSKSSIEWQASLIEGLFANASSRRSTKRSEKVDCLTRF